MGRVLGAWLVGLVVLGAWSVAAEPPPAGMVRLPPGEFVMGSEDFLDAKPIHRVAVKGFWMDETEVTNRQFMEFIRATGYRTLAERPVDGHTAANGSMAARGSLVFCPEGALVGTVKRDGWWCLVVGADWDSPVGPGSDLTGRLDHPVVHVAWEDAQAYAVWAGKRLPTEAEWEYAARGGLTGAQFGWGDSFTVAGRYMANTFQGAFPELDARHDGFAGTSPVKSYRANGYGLYDTAGNVWEWVADWYQPDAFQARSTTGLTVNPVGPPHGVRPASNQPPQRVTKGGSFLCTSRYCARYRPGGRGKNEPDSGASNLGFRLVKDLPAKVAPPNGIVERR